MTSKFVRSTLIATQAILASAVLADESAEAARWWSLRPLERPAVPAARPGGARHPVDRFIREKLDEVGLEPSPPADRRTLIRRLHYDLIGLPPSPRALESLLRDTDPLWYEKLVERLLASPHYGERWARHWLDVVHYGDTHGYDKDKLRPNAWPYRDYVIRAFNEDRPYARFVREQIAGDVYFPHTRDGIVATGFIAAGPWDFIGHVELPDTKIDGRIARHLDRDDMVATVAKSFLSTTATCAQCHDHKFDPIDQEHYYGLQAVFAALDRADRPYDDDPDVARRRARLEARRRRVRRERERLEAEVRQLAGSRLEEIDSRLTVLRKSDDHPRAAAFGYHSAIEPRDDIEKWVQVDLGTAVALESITVVGCHDDFNGIGTGFGFPRRFRIDVSDDPAFERSVTGIVDHTRADFDNPGTRPLRFEAGGARARYVRVTATRLAPRRNDFIFALAELLVRRRGGDDVNIALGKPVASLDSIESSPRWTRGNLVDGYYRGVPPGSGEELRRLERERERLLEESVEADLRDRLAAARSEEAEIETELEALPPRKLVYCGTVHHGSGNFRGTGPDGGQPRPIHVLRRGDVRSPGEPARPGALPLIEGVPAAFDLPEDHDEGARRRELAEWIVRRDNPLTWRSIVNRIWQYHFGRGLVATPNDFGRMGGQPTHPRLLDWLACELRDGGGSMKRLHRLIVTSATYRQSSATAGAGVELDADNRYLWRFRRRKLGAEAVRDSVLAVAGRLDRRFYGPGFRTFVLEKPEHSPHYQYHKQDPDDPGTHRRSIYRFIVRSQQDPFMSTLDCADPSLFVGKRQETTTALQALTLLNARFMIAMSEHFARRLEESGESTGERIDLAFRLALSREPSQTERLALSAHADEHGLAHACRLIFNLNEFSFVD